MSRLTTGVEVVMEKLLAVEKSAGLHCLLGRHAVHLHGNMGMLFLYHHQELLLSTHIWMFAI